MKAAVLGWCGAASQAAVSALVPRPVPEVELAVRRLESRRGRLKPAPQYILLLLATAAFAAVDGTVTNATTGKPQANATVTLFKLGQTTGPESLESVKSDAQGKFTIQQDPAPDQPYLIETAWDGVTYNHMLPPGSPHHAIELQVFDSSTRTDVFKIDRYMLVLQPATGALQVGEQYILQNDGKLAYNDPDRGGFRVYVPEGAQKINVMATAPQGMPIARAAEKTKEPNIYTVDFPVKPGTSRIEVRYSMPAATPQAFATRLIHKAANTQMVVPTGVKLNGDGIEFLGEQSHASFYALKTDNVKVAIEGTGTFEATAAAAQQSDEDLGNNPQVIMPYRIYDNLAWILAPALLALLFGFILLYRCGPAPQPAAAVPARGKRRG